MFPDGYDASQTPVAEKRSILEPVAVRKVLGEGGAVAGAKHRLALLLDQHGLAVEDDDELVDALVPVALAGNTAGLEHDVADPNVAKATRWTEPAKIAPAHLRSHRLGIGGPVGLLDRLEVELGHGIPPLAC